MGNRIEWLDALKGLGIILVVWGHLNIPLPAETIIYSFHMPLFFFVSGYLFKNTNRTFKEVVKRKFISLLIPYIFFAGISIPFGMALDIVFRDGISLNNVIMNFLFLNGSVGWNSPLWFLVVLFLVDIVFLLLYKSKLTLKITIPILFILGFGLAITNIEYPLGLHVMSWAIVFYALGFVCKKNEIVLKLSNSNLRTIMSIVILLFLNIVFGLILNDRVSLYHNYLDNYLYFYIAALSGILVLFLLMNKIPVSKTLKFFGENTLLILATHYFMIFGYKTIDRLLFNSRFLEGESYIISIVLAVITLLIYFPLAHLFNKYLPFAVGRKKKIKQPEQHSIAQ